MSTAFKEARSGPYELTRDCLHCGQPFTFVVTSKRVLKKRRFCTNSCGAKHRNSNPEWRKRQSELMRTLPRTKEWNENIGRSHKGIKKPGTSAALRFRVLRTRRRQSAARKGRKALWVTKRNLESNPMLNPVTVEKMAAKKRGVPQPGPAFRTGQLTEAQRLLSEALQAPTEYQVTCGKEARQKFTRLKHWYSIDIAIPAEKLAIELDGNYHLKSRTKQRDDKKDALLQFLGWRVLRFKEADVLADLAAIVASVQEALF